MMALSLGLVMGFGTLLVMLLPAARGVVDRPLPWSWLRLLWSLTFLAGGFIQLYSLHRPNWPLERLGISLTGLGCSIYGLALFANATQIGAVIGSVFLALALGHLVVLMAAEVAIRIGGRL